MNISLQNIFFIIILYLLFATCGKSNSEIITLILLIALFFLIKSDELYNYFTNKKNQ